VSRSGEKVIAAADHGRRKVSFLASRSPSTTWRSVALAPDLNDPPLYDPKALGDRSGRPRNRRQHQQRADHRGLRSHLATSQTYVGMIGIRFSVYGYLHTAGSGRHDNQGDYTSLFIFGALNAPIGGPPAFFVTGSEPALA